MLEDFLRVAQGVGMVMMASSKKSANFVKKATSPLTLYPQSPCQQLAYNIKTIQQASPTVSSSSSAGSTSPQSSEQVVPSSNTDARVQSGEEQVKIFFESYGNTNQQEPSKAKTQEFTVPIPHKKELHIIEDVRESNPIKREDQKQEFDSLMFDALSHGQTDLRTKVHQPTHTPQNTNQVQYDEDDEIKLHSIDSGLKEQKVPSNSISRAIQFAALGIKLGVNTAKEQLTKKSETNSTESSNSTDNTAQSEQSSVPKEKSKSLSVSDIMTEKNAEILAETLCKMRGAALKLGQMMSIQDESTVPPVIQKALDKVRHAANIMPQWQLESAMSSQFGEEWKSGFKQFDMKPIAAASIGQVHKGVLVDGREVAIKVQYPGVSESIDSDIKNVERVMKYTNLIPRGAFIGQTMEQARKELGMECDYIREAKCQKKFRTLIREDAIAERKRNHITDVPMSSFSVPDVIDEFTTRRVLCTELIKYGKTIDQIKDAPIEVRNRVAKLLMKLCLKELFEFRFMQTDPNWSNFFYDTKTGTMHLLDFGATMEFPQEFVDQYIRVVYASATKDMDTIIDASRKMGFLTGEESQEMNEAHATAAMFIGEPFSKEGAYDFRNQGIPERVTKIIPTMLKHRLTPPPPVTYSLHRKLSGAFLLCNKLDVVIPCREIFLDVYERYQERRAKETSKI